MVVIKRRQGFGINPIEIDDNNGLKSVEKDRNKKHRITIV
jgi:hypothetical protein